MTPRSTIRETDLYAPLRDHLTAQGYTVRAEVKGCDVTAAKGDALIVIELKRSMTLTLLAQAAQRQRVADSVYVAVPRPPGGAAGRAWKGIRHLLRRLELGLILVSVESKAPRVEIVFHPVPFSRRRQKSVRRALLEEMAGRSGDFNEGGSTRRKLVTAYRESAVQIACCLEVLGPTSPRNLRTRGCCAKTRSILYDNVYGWFERQRRGVYALSAKGHKELKGYPELVRAYRPEDSSPSGQGEDFP